MEPISLLVAVIGFIGRPLAEAVRDRYVDDLVRALPDMANPLADRLRRLLVGTATGDTEARHRLETELDANREAAAALAEAVQTRTGQEILSLERTPDVKPRTRDSRRILLDGYQRALYNLTLAAVFAGRPVAVDAALQGPNWLTACIARFGDSYNELRREVLPDPNGLWYSYDPDLVERGFGQDLSRQWPVTFYVRWMPDREKRDEELLRVEDQFQFEPETHFPRLHPDAPPAERWLQILRVHPRWVQLESFSRDFDIPRSTLDEVLDAVGEQHGLKASAKSRESLSFSDHPEEWKSLMKIRDPDEGIRLLMDATDRLVTSEGLVRTAVEGLLDRAQLGDDIAED